jgi:HSP20 family protein
MIELAAPGFQKNNFNIELEDEVLTISLDIEIDAKNINYTRREFNYNSFKRAFNLPESANSSKIAANYESGVLKINIPKKEESKPIPARKIKVA